MMMDDQQLPDLLLVYLANRTQLLSFAGRLSQGIPNLAEDAVQDLWVTIEECKGNIRHPRGWFFKVLKNHLLKKIKNIKREARAELCEYPDPSSAKGIPDSLEKGQDRAESLQQAQAIREIAKKDKNALITLNRLDGMLNPELALLLNVPNDAAFRQRVSRAMQQFFKKIAAYLNVPYDAEFRRRIYRAIGHASD